MTRKSKTPTRSTRRRKSRIELLLERVNKPVRFEGREIQAPARLRVENGLPIFDAGAPEDVVASIDFCAASEAAAECKCSVLLRHEGQ